MTPILRPDTALSLPSPLTPSLASLGLPSAPPHISPGGAGAGPTAGRVLLVLALVLVLVATSGWTTVRDRHAGSTPRAAALQAWHEGRVAGRPLPAPDAAPRTVARFFHGLTGAQRDRLATRHPLVVGNLDGAPLDLRYRANRTSLLRARALERERAADERLTARGREEAALRADRLASLLRADRRILAFDPTGRGRVAEVFGDLERAQRVSVVVPGSDTDLLSFERTPEEHTAPSGMARALHGRERATAPGVRTATVAWADYVAPRGVGVDAAAGRLAEEGAHRLVSFLGALPGRSPVALFCHSYGSVVCGVAADRGGHGKRLPERVSDIAVTGSPGVRADRASELVPRARLWALRNDDDWIADVPHLEVGGLGHGPDPFSPAFGARRLTARGADGHTGYFAPGTGSLANMAAVATGAYHRVDEV